MTFSCVFRLFRLSICYALVTAALVRPSACQIESAVDRIFAKISGKTEEHHSPGAAILVLRNGRAVFQRSYGIRGLRTPTAIDSHTNFRLASCTKQFTAMAVMLLVHDGKLRYDERLTEIFPDFPAYGKAITIRHLLNHTSGLPDYEELMEPSPGSTPRWSESHQIQDAEVLSLLKRQDQGKFTPGTQWSYSNSGYVVLGLIVQKVSGQSFPDFLRSRIFRPLHMDATLAYVKGGDEVSNRAYGHSVNAGVISETDQSSTSATLGDGGIYSNLADLTRWDDALGQHILLSAQEMQAALTPVTVAEGALPLWASGPGDEDPLSGRPVAYGFGWFLDPYRGHQRMWHFGETAGFRTAINRFPKDGLTFMVLCNRSDLDAETLALQVANLYLNPAAP